MRTMLKTGTLASFASRPLDEIPPIPGINTIALPLDDRNGGPSHAVLESRPRWLGNLAHPHICTSPIAVYRNPQSCGPARQSLPAGQRSGNRAPNQIPDTAGPARVAVDRGMYRGGQIGGVEFARVVGDRSPADIADVQFPQLLFWADATRDQGYGDFQHAGDSFMCLANGGGKPFTTINE